jgi:ubiquinol-cytochrome c reductase cytochrome c1 subunit
MRLLHRALPGALIASLLGALVAGPALGQEMPPLPKQNWSFAGPFGTYDRAAAQRGYEVYKQICSNCHSLNMAYYRDLSGIGLSPAQIKATAASVMVPSLDASGQPAERPGLPADHFRAPFPNELAARAANNGALPPDLSDIIKARAGGADYVFGILTGYSTPPAGMKMSPGMNYNEYYPGHQIAMPQMLHGGEVSFADGSPNSAADEAHDVVTFLSYISEPEMEQRKRIGVRMVLFLMVLTGLTYAVKRKVWADVEH